MKEPIKSLENIWPADFIALNAEVCESGEHRQFPARYFRKEFELPRKPQRATAKVCGLGVFDLYVNGSLFGDRLFAPGYTYFSRRALYVVYDIAKFLNEGTNAIGVVVGNGRFFAPRVKSPTAFTDFGLPCLSVDLGIEDQGSEDLTIQTDASWKVTDQGPIRLNNEYDGETYDARLEMPGWSAAGFDDSSWYPAQVCKAPTERIDRHDYPPDRITEVLPPVSIEKRGKGRYLVDFGQNFYGNVRCRVSGPRGHEVSWTAAYSLNTDGSLRTRDNRDALSRDTYILKGEGTEVWSPRFRGQGMRRILVENWPGELKLADLEGQVIHADFEAVGRFECSSALFNRLYSNIRWGQRMYRRHGVPVDPDRNERQGWLGDIAMNVYSDAYNWDVHTFFRKWLIDIQLDQKENGCLPDVSPNVWQFYSDNVDWPAAYPIITDALFRLYGDVDTARRHLPSIHRWLHYIKGKLVLADGTVDANTYTDWCDVSTIGKDNHKSTTTSPPFISSAYWVYCCRLVTELAQGVDEQVIATEVSQWAEASQRGFLARFVDSETGATPGDTQCELAMLLGMRLVDGELVDKVARRLNQAVTASNDSPTVGLVGMQWLMLALEHPACGRTGFDLVGNKDFPGWGYMIEKGATTIWENWDTDQRDPGMNSEALLMLAGGLNAWFFRVPAGIRPAPGSIRFERVLLAPVLGTLDYVSANHHSASGVISSEWTRDSGMFEWKFSVPEGVEAELRIPKECQHPMTLNGVVLNEDLPVPLGEGEYVLCCSLR